jgi:hypothetical protein
LHGYFSAFYWGQHYGGGEPYAVAAVFALFGQSAFTLGLTPVLLDAVAAALVFALGRRLFSPAVGLGAAVLFLDLAGVDTLAVDDRVRLSVRDARLRTRPGRDRASHRREREWDCSNVAWLVCGEKATA